MAEHPILFSDPMVISILEGRKTVTRRIVKRPKSVTEEEFQQACEWMRDHNTVEVARRGPADGLTTILKSPYGQRGDRLWVREAHGFDLCNLPVYRASAARGQRPADGKWRPSIFMPRSACRLELDVVSVTVERLQCINENEASSEGMLTLFYDSEFMKRHFPEYIEKMEKYRCSPGRTVLPIGRPPMGPSMLERFKVLWSEINGRNSWDENPWVWRVQFDHPIHF